MTREAAEKHAVATRECPACRAKAGSPCISLNVPDRELARAHWVRVQGLIGAGEYLSSLGPASAA